MPGYHRRGRAKVMVGTPSTCFAAGIRGPGTGGTGTIPGNAVGDAGPVSGAGLHDATSGHRETATSQFDTRQTDAVLSVGVYATE